MSNKTESEHIESVVNFDEHVEKNKEGSYSSSLRPNAEEARNETLGTKKKLETRHIQMIALGGTIGTGIFLNSGRVIAQGGPAGALIAYCVIGFLVYCIMTCVGEMATYIPLSGSVFQYSTRFIDKSLGFAMGLNKWWACTSTWYMILSVQTLIRWLNMSVAVELTAAAATLRFWKPLMPDAAWASIFWVIIVSLNLLSVRLYGEIEYWLALFKILIVIVFIIIAILVTSGAVGGETIGFSYWKSPGAFANGGLGTVNVLLAAGFSFFGSDNVALAAGETKNPTKAIPRAIRNVFWRIVIFYIATILLLGMCLPYNDPRLNFAHADSSTASFTLVFEKAGIEAGAHIVNACIFTSILSSANSIVYSNSRIMLGLARDGNLPNFFTRVNRYGAPYYAVFGSTIVSFICIFLSIYSSNTVLVWCLNLSSVSGFIYWSVVGFVHLRFRRGYIHQGRDLNDLPYRSSLFPYASIFAAILPILIILGQGYDAFYPKWNAVAFVGNYLGVVPFTLAYILHKLFIKSKIVPLEEIDYKTGVISKFDIEFDEQNDTKWKKWSSYFT